MKKITTFPYQKYKGILSPIIRIQLKGPSGLLESRALVDSGASHSIFLTSVARDLGIQYTKGKVSYTMVGNGGYIPLYTHIIPIKIGPTWHKTEVGFSPHLAADFNLLGQNVFKNFVITFNQHRRSITFKPYSS